MERKNIFCRFGCEAAFNKMKKKYLVDLLKSHLLINLLFVENPKLVDLKKRKGIHWSHWLCFITWKEWDDFSISVWGIKCDGHSLEVDYVAVLSFSKNIEVLLGVALLKWRKCLIIKPVLNNETKWSIAQNNIVSASQWPLGSS